MKKAYVKAARFQLPGLTATGYTAKITLRFDEILTRVTFQNTSGFFWFFCNKTACYCTAIMMRTA